MLDLAVGSNRNHSRYLLLLLPKKTEPRLLLLKDRSIIDFVSAYTEQDRPKVRCVHAVYS